jgi:hypothetical protein
MRPIPHLALSLLPALAALQLGCPSPARPPRDAVAEQGDARREAGAEGGGRCGNGRVEGTESCDGADLNGQSCASLGLLFGALGCTPGCRFDFGGCGTCGDGKLQGAEACDGAELRGQTCTSAGFTGGSLRCTACQLDTSGCTAASPGHATIVYGTATELVIRRMDTATGALASEAAPAGLAGARWVVNQISPTDPTDEVAAVSSETATGLQLHLLHRGSNTWTLDGTVPLGIPATEAQTRPFDLVYEAKSGEALLVYSDNTNNPRFRTYTRSGGWAAAQGALAAPLGTAPVRWVVLARQQRTDEIALAYSDASTFLFNAIWDGGAFVEGSKSNLSADTDGMGRATQSFDAVYEDASGDLLVFASDSCCTCAAANIKRYHEAMVDKAALTNSICGLWTFMKLAPLRGSDAVAIVGDQAFASVWSGSAWYPASHLWPGPPGPTPRWADVAWVGSQPVALVVHRGWAETNWTGGAGKVHWLRYNLVGGGWQSGAPLAVAGLGELLWSQLEAFPAEDRVMAVFSDDVKNLWAMTYSQAKGWTVANGGAALAANSLSTTSARAFSVAISQK